MGVPALLGFVVFGGLVALWFGAECRRALACQRRRVEDAVVVIGGSGAARMVLPADGGGREEGPPAARRTPPGHGGPVQRARGRHGRAANGLAIVTGTNGRAREVVPIGAGDAVSAGVSP